MLTTIVPTVFGRMCLKMIRRVGRAGDARGVDELPLAQGQELGPHEPGQPGPEEQPEHERDASTCR